MNKNNLRIFHYFSILIKYFFIFIKYFTLDIVQMDKKLKFDFFLK